MRRINILLPTFFNGRSAGEYNVTAKEIKMIGYKAKRNLTEKINDSIRSNDIKSFNRGIIIPIHKSRKKLTVENTRPIILLPIVGSCFPEL